LSLKSFHFTQHGRARDPVQVGGVHPPGQTEDSSQQHLPD
jgi:hypothetical protein